jgi:hypothetical protein
MRTGICPVIDVRMVREGGVQNPFDLDRVVKWSANAFNATPEDEWLVIKIPKANQTHFMCDFCDGDELDNFEWFEGAFKQSLTIKDLIDYKNLRTREERRDSERMTQIRTFPSEPWERHSDSTVDHDTTSDEEDKGKREHRWIQSFRDKVEYKPKPTLKDLFASKKRESEEGESSESDSQESQSVQGAFGSQRKSRGSGVILPYRMVD